MTGVGVGHQAQRLIPEGELGVAEQGVVGGGDEPPSHVEDGVGRAGPDAGGEFLGLLLEFGAEGLRHDGLLKGGMSPVIPNYTEVNTFPTNFGAAYPAPGGPAECA